MAHLVKLAFLSQNWFTFPTLEKFKPPMAQMGQFRLKKANFCSSLLSQHWPFWAKIDSNFFKVERWGQNWLRFLNLYRCEPILTRYGPCFLKIRNLSQFGPSWAKIGLFEPKLARQFFRVCKRITCQIWRKFSGNNFQFA